MNEYFTEHQNENSPEKECGGKRIRIKEKITGINCDRRDA